MPGSNTSSDNASNSNNAADQDFLRMQRNTDNMLFVMIGMVATWLGWIVVSLIELA
jgi:hypothetical protein